MLMLSRIRPLLLVMKNGSLLIVRRGAIRRLPDVLLSAQVTHHFGHDRYDRDRSVVGDDRWITGLENRINQ